MAIFDRGDIVLIGSELHRLCFVLSTKEFNKLGLTLVAPITQYGNNARFNGFAVPLIDTGTQTQGVVMVNGVRTLDLAGSGVKEIEKAPIKVINEVLAILTAILE